MASRMESLRVPGTAFSTKPLPLKVSLGGRCAGERGCDGCSPPEGAGAESGSCATAGAAARSAIVRTACILMIFRFSVSPAESDALAAAAIQHGIGIRPASHSYESRFKKKHAVINQLVN